jgi:hypothetical protein
MSILNLTFPNVLLVQYKYLLHYGATRREELADVCTPLAVVSDRQYFNNTLNAAKRYKLFEENSEGLLQIAGDMPPDVKSKKNGMSILPSLVCRLIMADHINQPLWKTAEDKADDADFTRATAWALAQDIFNFPTSGPEAEKLVERQITGIDCLQIIQNPSVCWPGFLRWASFLGFGWGSFNVDPTLAVKRILPDVFAGTTTLDAVNFIQLLGKTLPVLDGGKYRVEIEKHLDSSTGWTASVRGRISSSLSLALERLHLAGNIELLYKSDSPNPIQLTYGPGKPAKHVSVFTNVRLIDKGVNQ